MNQTQGLTRLAWKNYRETRVLWCALAGGVFVCQWLYVLSLGENADPFARVTLGIISITLGACGAIASVVLSVCGEREHGTEARLVAMRVGPLAFLGAGITTALSGFALISCVSLANFLFIDSLGYLPELEVATLDKARPALTLVAYLVPAALIIWCMAFVSRATIRSIAVGVCVSGAIAGLANSLIGNQEHTLSLLCWGSLAVSAVLLVLVYFLARVWCRLPGLNQSKSSGIVPAAACGSRLGVFRHGSRTIARLSLHRAVRTLLLLLWREACRLRLFAMLGGVLLAWGVTYANNRVATMDRPTPGTFLGYMPQFCIGFLVRAIACRWLGSGLMFA